MPLFYVHIWATFNNPDWSRETPFVKIADAPQILANCPQYTCCYNRKEGGAQRIRRV